MEVPFKTHPPATKDRIVGTSLWEAFPLPVKTRETARVWRFGVWCFRHQKLKLVKASCFAGEVLENHLVFYSFVRSRERLVSEYFLKILWKTRVWRFCWKSLVFHNFAKSREKLMFGYFLEIISGLSLMSHVKSRERLVFGYFSLFCWKSLVFHSFAKSRETLVFGDFLKWSLVFPSYVKSRERLVFGDFIEMISGLSKLCKVVWNARVWRFSWNVLWSFAAM